jgi:alpha-glucuronidase
MKTARSLDRIRWGLATVLLLVLITPARAETGHDAWLRYAAIHWPSPLQRYHRVVVLGESEVTHTAEAELVRGLQGMLGRRLQSGKRISSGAIVLGTLPSLEQKFPHLSQSVELEPDGYWLKTTILEGDQVLLVAGSNDRGVLYGVFALLRRIALRQAIDRLDEKQNPSAPIRWTNEWNNLDGSVERGYGGRSIFFAGSSVVPDLGRVQEYARLLASTGINGCVVNNVNADTRILASDFLPQLARVAAGLRPWGIRLSIAVDFASPEKIGGLNTFDPLDARVAGWWKQKADEIYRLVQDFGGFLMKADSEGRAGPSAYGRTHAQGANVIARALKPHGGILIYRAFVYDHHLDWNNLKADRARAAYDSFAPRDGEFDDNVAVQIKYGPIDFQVREPVSPLIGALQHTNEVLELQITQEYTGQQRHLCFLAPMWKEVLDFDLHVNGGNTPAKKLVSGQTFHRPVGGFVGVANVGQDSNWLGYDLAQSNLYAFGRLAWDPNLSAREIVEEWTRLTFGNDPTVIQTIVEMQLESWSAYEEYTGAPLGLQTLTNILGSHYEPGPETADGNGWGQWIRADQAGVGMDRTVSTGTGFIGQYAPPVARYYESLETCPDNLLLFFHHVPYTYVLHSGKTVIQTIYDSHYDGAAQAQTFPRRWKALRGRIDDDRYRAVLARLDYQAGHALVWRAAINDWFFRLSGIPDVRNRVGHPSHGRVGAD